MASFDPGDENVNSFRRSSDSCAGAVTGHDTLSWMATKFIPKGSEIFVDYGTEYFTGRPAKYGVLPLGEDYRTANDLVKRYENVTGGGTIDANANQGIWDIMKDIVTPAVKSALPENVSDVGSASEKGVAFHALPKCITSPEWVRENGECMDNLRVKPSTIRHAGRGAFARRFIPKGVLISPIPLVHIHAKAMLDTYDLVLNPSTGEAQKKNDIVVGQQLLLNYCFGHNNSTIALFPYATAVQAINHDSKGFNAEIIWSKSMNEKSDWLNVPVADIPDTSAGLVFDLVATRDILPDEEVFIDYGKEWEEAWNKHVKEWAPGEDSKSYVYPEKMNAPPLLPLRSVEEQIANPYPSNLETTCLVTLNSYESGDAHRWSHDANASFNSCSILLRYERLYRVKLLKEDGTDILLFDVPRDAIKFVGVKYSSDVFLKNAFRHAIGIPDEIFPDKWNNVHNAT